MINEFIRGLRPNLAVSDSDTMPPPVLCVLAIRPTLEGAQDGAWCKV
jgi:hypothetical protein